MTHLSPEQREAYIEGAKALKGSDRRLFKARIVKSLGRGGASVAARELGWDRTTIRKGIGELDSGQVIKDRFWERGRKKAEEKLPRLLDDIRAIVDGQSQTDPTFKTTKLFARITAPAVRQALIDDFGYTDDELPHVETIRVKLNQLGYRLRAVKKSQPKKNTRNRRHL